MQSILLSHKFLSIFIGWTLMLFVVIPCRGFLWTTIPQFAFPRPKSFVDCSRIVSRLELQSETSQVNGIILDAAENIRNTKDDTTMAQSTEDKTFVLKEDPNNELLDAFTGAAKKASEDLFVFLRKNAALALTKSLPASQRKELLSRVAPEALDMKVEDDFDLDGTGRSINEKITAFDMETSKISEFDDALVKKAEAAVEARIRNELAIQQRLINDKRKVDEDEISRIKSELAVQQQLIQNYTDKDHPLLGHCIVDLGYKRIHTVPAETLATIPVWQKQRIYRHNRAKQMATDKLKTQHLGLPGVIILHEDVNSGKLSILDGQHRVGMMQVLLQRKDKKSTKSANVDTTLDLDNVVVEVYPQTSALAQDLFVEVNKAEPVKLIDLPGVGRAKDRKIITDAVEKLSDLHPDMFKPSQRCRIPHLNVDNVRDNLFAANVVARHKLTTSKQLLDWMVEQNNVLRVKYATSDDTAAVSQSALEKARKFDFYMGLESNWLYN